MGFVAENKEFFSHSASSGTVVPFNIKGKAGGREIWLCSPKNRKQFEVNMKQSPWRTRIVLGFHVGGRLDYGKVFIIHPRHCADRWFLPMSEGLTSTIWAYRGY